MAKRMKPYKDPNRKRIAITVNGPNYEKIMDFLKKSPAFEPRFLGILMDGFLFNIFPLLQQMEKDILNKTKELSSDDAKRYSDIINQAMNDNYNK